MIDQQKKRKINPMLLNVIIISAAVHVLVGVFLGGITIVKYIIAEEAMFDEPPAVAEVEPPKEVKVEIKLQAKPKAQPMNQLRMKPVSHIALPQVSVDLPTMSESFTVSSVMGSSGGSLMGGAGGRLGIGMSDVSIFGLKSQAERILFLIDASPNMMTDEKGGLHSYKVIKDEITTMVGKLTAGTLFNVAMYDAERVMFFKPQLVSAGQVMHSELIHWIGAVNNSASKVGLKGMETQTIGGMLERSADELVFQAFQERRNQRSASALTHLAVEQNVDAVFIISGSLSGLSRLERSPTASETAKWDRVSGSEAHKQKVADYQADSLRVTKLVKAAQDRENAARKKKGQPAKIWKNHTTLQTRAKYYGIKFNVEQPPRRPRQFLDVAVIEKYFKSLVDELYGVLDQSGPSINVVVFLAGNESFSEDKEDNLKKYVRLFEGKYRIIRGLDEIRKASSASAEVATN